MKEHHHHHRKTRTIIEGFSKDYRSFRESYRSGSYSSSSGESPRNSLKEIESPIKPNLSTTSIGEESSGSIASSSESEGASNGTMEDIDSM
jgi:hypothetical protein